MSLSTHLAQNLESLRHARKMTQAQLAKIAGLPRSTITHMESGDGNPSIQSLAKVSAALQVSIDNLLVAPRPVCALIKAEDVHVEDRGGALLYKLLPDQIPGMEIDRLEIPPGRKLAGKPHLESTKEYLTCLHGTVVVSVAGERFEVDKGDILSFPGHRPHSYSNAGRDTAICVSVVTLAPGELL